MNRVKVRISNQRETEYFIIRTVDDLKELCEMITEAGLNLTKRLINTTTPIDRWDHLRYGGFEGPLLTQLIMKMRFGKPVIPLTEPAILAAQRCEALTGNFMDGETLLVNDKLGYCPLTADCELLDEWEYKENKMAYCRLIDGAKFINLENDEHIETTTANYFKFIKEPFSYITQLHRFSKSELTDVFKQFKAKGGTTVHVYTTASNVAQMYDYFDAAIDADLTQFIFEWSAGPPHGIEAFLKHARRTAKVRVLNDEVEKPA